MKKLLAFWLALVIVLVCSACTPSNSDELSNNESSVTLTESNTDKTEDAEDEDKTDSDDLTDDSVLEECAHNYMEATCTAPKTCTLCGVIQGVAVGHTYSVATCTTPATCTKCNATQGAVKEHIFSYTSCSAPGTCTQCGATQSAAPGHDYVLGECIRVVSGKTCGHYNPSYCPKIYFTGDMSSMTSKKDVRNITFEYKSKDQTISGAAKIKVQGTSSLGYAKKNYTVNFYENGDYAKALGINVGWGSQDEYCLKANWIDKSHSRNVVTAKLAGEAQAKYGLLENTPNNGVIDGFPVEVYINGSFHGVYTMNIPKADWMFAMDENNPNHIVICGEGWLAANYFKADPDFNTWAVEVGPENDQTLTKMKRLFTFIRESSDDEFVENFEQYLDLDATLNYYVMMDYGWMPDNAGKNMLLATYDGEVWHPSLYDLDTTWGAHWQGTSLYDYKNTLLEFGDSLLWSRMEQLFSKELAQRYFELREDVLDPSHVMAKFKSFYNTIPKEALEREKTKWGNNIPGYDISQIQEYLDAVAPRLDAKYSAWL